MRPQEVGAGDVGTVRLVSAQRVPSIGVVVDAIVEGCCKGPVMVEPVVGSSGIELECMVVEADGSGKVSLVTTNPSPEVVQLARHRSGHYKTWTVDYGLDCGLDHGWAFLIEMSCLTVAAWPRIETWAADE